MSDDINSPRVRQVLAIHAQQAADAKAALLEAITLVGKLEAQLREMYTVAVAGARFIHDRGTHLGALRVEFETRGTELERLARGLTDDPGPCRCSTERTIPPCSICGE